MWKKFNSRNYIFGFHETLLDLLTEIRRFVMVFEAFEVRDISI